MESFWNIILSGGAGSLAATLVVWWAKHHYDHHLRRDLEQYKSELDRQAKDNESLLSQRLETHKAGLKEQADLQIERYKAELHAQIAPEVERAKADVRRDESRWAWLDQRVVESLASIYGKLLDVRTDAMSFIIPPDSEERWISWIEKLDASTRSFFPEANRCALYLDEQTWECFEEHRKAFLSLRVTIADCAAEVAMTKQHPLRIRIFESHNAYEQAFKVLKEQVKVALWHIHRGDSPYAKEKTLEETIDREAR